MAYTKTTDFAAKDALISGDPAKVVKGTEIGAEFDAIQTADGLNLKRDGTSTASASIPMGGNKLTGLGAGTTAGDSVRYEQFASPPAIGNTAANTVRGTTVTATTQFSGPGTGLTGTAASLNIGGNAATATSATTATTATSATSATSADTASHVAGGAAGQVLYQSSANTTAKLSAGTSSQVLIGGASAPAWAAFSSFFTGSNQSLASTGFQKIPGGLIVQWGEVSTGPSGPPYSVAESFATAFTTAVYAVVATAKLASATSDVSVSSVTTSGFTLNTSVGSTICYWIAVGK